jgi:hypothetical protein
VKNLAISLASGVSGRQSNVARLGPPEGDGSCRLSGVGLGLSQLGIRRRMNRQTRTGRK